MGAKVSFSHINRADSRRAIQDDTGYCGRMGCEVEEINVQSDHVHLLVSMPPKESVSKLLSTVKGKTAIQIFRQFPHLKQKSYWGNHFWARGYCVDTVGINEEIIRKYVKYQEKEETRQERLRFK